MIEGSRKRAWTVAAMLLTMAFVLAAGALAHEGHHHDAKGTIKAVGETKLDLTAADGAERSFVVSETTKFVRGTTQVKREEVAVGERAVVMYETKDGADRALEVKLAEKKP